MTEPMYFKSDRPESLQWWDDAQRGRGEFRQKVHDFEAMFGMGRKAVVLSGWGLSLGGLEVIDSDYDCPPKGWRVIDNNRFSVLVPLKRSKVGKAIAEGIEAVRFGEPRMKLPGFEWGLDTGEPGLFIHEGFVWLDSSSGKGIDRDVWQEVRRSEFLIAQGRHAEEREKELAK